MKAWRPGGWEAGNGWKWEGGKERRWEGEKVRRWEEIELKAERSKVKGQRKRLEGLEAGKQGSSTRLKGKREGEEVRG